jgi:ubiquinone biosynthesis protein Coq4
MKNLIRKLKGARAFIKIVNDPNRLNEVFNLSDQTADTAVLNRLAGEFAKDPVGAEALRDMPRLGRIDLPALRALPKGTLGRTYADFMADRGLDPASIPTLPVQDQAEFVQAHLYETHDLWHVVTGFDTDVAGELGLQAFYGAQFRGPLPPAILAAGLLNTSFYSTADHDRRFRAIVLGWTLGRKARQLFGRRWDQMWERPIAEVRAELALDRESTEALIPAA